MRRLLVFVVLFACLKLHADSPVLTLDSNLIPSPAAIGARAPQLFSAADGVRMIWIEPAETKGERLRISTFDAAKRRWGTPRDIVRRENFAKSSANTPQLAAVGDTLVALWFEAVEGASAHTSRGEFSISINGGKTWRPSLPLAPASTSQEFGALTAMADGRFLAVWLDGRAKKPAAPTAASEHAHGTGDQQLFARTIGAGDTDNNAKEVMIDARVCDCCATGVTAYPDGSALVVYRGRSADEVRDIRAAAFRNGAWQQPRPLNTDNWKIAACPINGPAIAAYPGRAAVAWFTAADNSPRVLAALSTDAGGRFFQPVRIDDGRPLGRPGIVFLKDSSAYVSWIENFSKEGEVSFWLRRLAPNAETSVPVLLTTAESAKVIGFPRLALLKDYDTTPAQLIVAHTLGEDDSAQLVTRLLVLPPPETFTAGRPCATCPPAEDTLPGHSLRGRVVGIGTDKQSVVINHDLIPGVITGTKHEFRVDWSKTPTLRADTAIVARIEQRDGAWWIFDVRPL